MTQETMTLSPTLQQPPHYSPEMTSFQFLLTFLYTSPGHTSKSFSTRIHTRDCLYISQDRLGDTKERGEKKKKNEGEKIEVKQSTSKKPYTAIVL